MRGVVDKGTAHRPSQAFVAFLNGRAGVIGGKTGAGGDSPRYIRTRRPPEKDAI